MSQNVSRSQETPWVSSPSLITPRVTTANFIWFHFKLSININGLTQCVLLCLGSVCSVFLPVRFIHVKASVRTACGRVRSVNTYDCVFSTFCRSIWGIRVQCCYAHSWVGLFEKKIKYNKMKTLKFTAQWSFTDATTHPYNDQTDEAESVSGNFLCTPC